ncbi:conserved hypothetical protein [Ricinus communis]|uniref:Uncharacterized protein n=1 Tax=Ricinus communis TaxID=3988 RepID=B9TAS2_RICCO|nr:conserved hypothetical protein [Ricinus communis]
MKDPRPASYSFVGRDRGPFFFLNRAQRSQIQSRQGGLPDTESSYSNLAMLMEQEKFSDDMDPKR